MLIRFTIFFLGSLILLSSCKQKSNDSEQKFDSNLDFLDNELGHYFDSDIEKTDSLSTLPETFSTKNATYTFQKISGEMFEYYNNSVHNQAILSNLPPQLKKKDSCFILQLSHRKDTLCDNLTDDFSNQYVDYHYLGYWDSLPFLIFESAIYEEVVYFVYNLKTGQKDYLWSIPLLSPDKSTIITFSYDLVAGFQPNGMQLFRILDSGLEKEFELEFDTWGPDSCVWLNRNEIILKQNIINFDTYNIEREEYALLTISPPAS